uniref:Uncharacterized protein n=1 Tax=Ditylenchus dipsaci TaxID=166011 RepID=A0A915DCX9_9BILA
MFSRKFRLLLWLLAPALNFSAPALALGSCLHNFGSCSGSGALGGKSRAAHITVLIKMDRIQAAYGSDSSAEEEVEKLRKRKSYSTEWKLEVVKHARLVSIHSAAKSSMWIERLSGIGSRVKIHFHRSNNPLQLEKQKASSCGGRPLQFQDLDRELAK